MYEELTGILNQYSGLARPASSFTSDQIFDALNISVEARKRRVWTKFAKRLRDIKLQAPMSSERYAVLIDILSTLVENSNHSEFAIGDVRLNSVERSGFPTKALRIMYRSKTGRIDQSRGRRACVSPIPDKATPTYHFGLFLAAAQTRMVGGAASLNIPTSNIGQSFAFEIGFELPLQ